MIRLTLPVARLLFHSKVPARFSEFQFDGHGRPTFQAIEMLQPVKVLSNVKCHNYFCTCSNDRDLSRKKCVPCKSEGIQPILELPANELIKKVPGWNLTREDGPLKLQRSWRVKSFMKGLELFKAVADLAETEGHHPDLHLVGWNNVKIEIWTHSVGGLTENDFILSAKINSLDLSHLLKKAPTTEHAPSS